MSKNTRDNAAYHANAEPLREQIRDTTNGLASDAETLYRYPAPHDPLGSKVTFSLRDVLAKFGPDDALAIVELDRVRRIAEATEREARRAKDRRDAIRREVF